MLRVAVLAILVLTACSTVPEGAYSPAALAPRTLAVSHALYRAGRAAGDDAERYAFALIQTRDVSAYSVEGGTFYFSDGLVRLPPAHIDALVAHEVAHEVLGHAGQRRALGLSMSAGFTVLGVAVPGAGLVDLLAAPLVVRAFTRDQEIAADLKAVEILREMGYAAPRRTMAEALQAAAAINGRPPGWILAREPSFEDRLSALEPLEPPGVPATTAQK